MAAPLLVAVLAVVAGLTLAFIWNEDLWWYLASGRWILDHQGFPDSDPFLYTSIESTRFPTHSWLWSVTLELVRRVLGIPGIVGFGCLVAMATTILIFCSARADRWGLANSAFCALVIASAAERLSLKSELASWLLLVVFFYLLERTAHWTWRHLALLAALQWLWANLHAGYPLGIAIVLAYVAGEWVPRVLGRRSKRLAESPIPWWTPVLLFVAPLITPQINERLRMLEASSDITVSGLSGGGGVAVALNELQGTFSVADPTYAKFYLLGLGVGLLVLAVAPRSRFQLARFFFLIGMAVLAYTAIRHVTGLMIAVALVSLRSLGERQIEAKRQPARGPRTWAYTALAALWGIGLLLSAGGLWRLANDLEAGQSGETLATLSPLSTCPGAADFVLEEELRGPIFNDMILGGYLTYRLFPSHQLFVDNRILAPRIQNKYIKISTSEAEWRAAEQKYGFQTAILSHLGVPAETSLRGVLARDPRWRQVYLDPLAVVFVKLPATTRSRSRIDNEGELPFLVAEKSAWKLPRKLARVFFRTDVESLLHQYLAVLGRLQQTNQVIELASAALAQRPEDAVLYRHRGSARMMNRRFDEGIEDLEIAIDIEPNTPANHFTLALALRDRGRWQEARSAIGRALQLDPGNRRYLDLKQRLELAPQRGVGGR